MPFKIYNNNTHIQEDVKLVVGYMSFETKRFIRTGNTNLGVKGIKMVVILNCGTGYNHFREE